MSHDRWPQKRGSRMSSQKERESIFFPDPKHKAYYTWDLPPVPAKLQVTLDKSGTFMF